MLIDEDRVFCLRNIAQMKKNGRIIESDHNSMIAEFEIEIKRKKPSREEMFNLRNRDCQEAFKNATEVNPELIKCFENDLPIEVQSRKWMKNFNSVLHQSFRKVRIVNTNKKKKENLKMKSMLNERIQMRQDLKTVNITEEMKDKIELRIRQIEEDMEKEITEEYQKEVIEIMRELGGSEEGTGGDRRNKMWKLLKKNYPKILTALPVGKKDRNGNIITNHEGLKHLYLQTYINRLRNRPIKSGFEEIKKMKTELFELRLELAKNNKSQPWTMGDLEKALKGLKSDKARDPNGLVNELFKEGIAGRDLKLSLLKFLNRIKE